MQFKTAYPLYWCTLHLTLKPVYRPELKKKRLSLFILAVRSTSGTQGSLVTIPLKRQPENVAGEAWVGN